MVDVFISYAREDRSQAAELAELLEEAGYTVWWDW
ncbi:MAG: TIR domain-containing protein, partial [Hyphomicrobiales bacterium]